MLGTWRNSIVARSFYMGECEGQGEPRVLPVVLLRGGLGQQALVRLLARPRRRRPVHCRMVGDSMLSCVYRKVI